MIEEPGSAETAKLCAEAGAIVTSWISYAEAHAALARAHDGGRLSGIEVDRGVTEVDRIWLHMACVEVDESVVRQAAELAREHRLRAYDAVQLASAHRIAGADGAEFLCWDDELRDAAEAGGLAVARP